MSPSDETALRLLERLARAHAQPGWNSYVEHEVRVGAPLSYVAGKLSNALKAVHETYRNVSLGVPDDLSKELGWPYAPPSFSAKNDALLGPLVVALSDGLKAYMALENTVGWTPELWADVVELDYEAFEDWLGCVAAAESLSDSIAKYRSRLGGSQRGESELSGGQP